MAKFETNLNKKDKMTIAIVLFVGALFAFSWYLIKPAITDIRSLSDDIEQAEILKTQYRNKIINLTSAESAFDRVVTDLSDSTTGFYEIMPSSTIDRMATNYVLSFGLFPESLEITMPTGPIEETPYVYSEAYEVQINSVVDSLPTPTPITTTGLGLTASGSVSSSSGTTPSVEVESLFVPYNQARANAVSTSYSGVQGADLTLIMTGSPEACQALIDDLCTKPAIRITGFEWMTIDPVEHYDEETGEVEYIDPDYTRLRVSLRLYMADVADYEAMVSDAVEAAGAEG
ncbi:MAG: hypothetical protein IK142_01900 [Clostridiales bacterium]|nr:hypothetical protein [Clostridiales bacterium]